MKKTIKKSKQKKVVRKVAKVKAKPKSKKPVKKKVAKKAAPKKTPAKKKAVKKKSVPKKTTTKKKTVKKITPKKPASKKKVIKKAVPKKVTPKKTAAKTPRVPRLTRVSGPTDVKPYRSVKNEEYMNEEQLEHFRKVLLKWKSQLMEEVDRTMHHMQDDVSNYPDPVDRATQEEEFSLELRARDRERKLLRKIEETLNRINDQDYGYCDDCGDEVGVKRLEARPTANQCIECKTIAEIREKQIGEGR